MMTAGMVILKVAVIAVTIVVGVRKEVMITVVAPVKCANTLIRFARIVAFTEAIAIVHVQEAISQRHPRAAVVRAAIHPRAAVARVAIHPRAEVARVARVAKAAIHPRAEVARVARVQNLRTASPASHPGDPTVGQHAMRLQHLSLT